MTKEEFLAPTTEGQLSIDDKAEFWAEFKRLHEAARKLKVWKARFKDLFGDADVITINGEIVATHALGGAVNQAQLRADHPELFDQFTTIKQVREFDSALFEQAHPELANQYRSRSLRIK
jgi:hypothetical protein